MKRYFFGRTGSQDVQDAQDLTFETDLAASEAAAGWRRGCRANIQSCAALPVMPPATSPNCRSESTTRRLGRLTLAPRKDGRRNIGS
jgi:hypothetical protein